MNFTNSKWIVKTEPSTWSWQDQERDLVTPWDGVRNHQANNNMKKMKLGDECLFYHSIKGKEIIGIVKVVNEWYPDKKDNKSGKFGMVDVKVERKLNRPITLEMMKAEPRLKSLVFLKQQRLSVSPVTQEEWMIIIDMAE